MEKHEEVLHFWFGELDDVHATGNNGALWFSGGEEADRTIRERFGELHTQASSGELDGWLDAPRSLLALIIVLDQFSRNIFRGKPEAFAQDAKAQALVRRGLDLGYDGGMRFVERAFVYMPFMHAETMDLHRRGQALFDALVRACPEPHRKPYENFASFMEKHTAIISRFGRYPHRNAILSRTSTGEELAFLKEPGSSF